MLLYGKFCSMVSSMKAKVDYFMEDFMGIFAFISHATYSKYQVKQKLTLFKCIIFAYLITLSIRFFTFGLALKYGWSDYIKLEPFQALVTDQFRLYKSGDLALCMCPLPLFGVHCQYWYFFSSAQLYFTKLCHQLLVSNRRKFFELNSKFKPKLSLTSPLVSVKNLVNCVVLMWSSKKARFFERKLSCFPEMSGQVRIRAVLVATFLELSALGFFVLVGLIALATTLYHQQTILLMFTTLPRTLSLLFNGSLMVYSCVSTIILTLYGMASIIMFCFVYSCCELKQLNTKLSISLSAVSQNQISSWVYARRLAVFRRIHLAIWRHGIRMKYEFVDRLLFSAFVSNFLVNVYLVVMLLFAKTIQLPDKLVLGFVITVQMSVALVGSYALSFIAQYLYKCSRFVHRSQFYLDLLGAKLRMMVYYEKIHTTQTITYSVGPIGNLTFLDLAQFIFLYGTYIMYVAKLAKKNIIQV